MLAALLLTAASLISPASSTNWSGYAFQGGPFTYVAGTFTVPVPETGDCNDYAAEWVGIDGYSNSDLIQAGVAEQMSFNCQPTYSAWWEILPDYSINVPLPVTGGNKVTVDIKDQGANQWLITIVNDATDQTWEQTFTYAGPATSAEWVVESPEVGGNIGKILPYGVVTWTGLKLNGRAALLDDVWLEQSKVPQSVPEKVTVPRLMSQGFTCEYV